MSIDLLLLNHISLKFCSFFSQTFFPLCSDYIISIGSSSSPQTHGSAISTLLVNPSSEFSVLIIVVSSSRIFICFFLIFSISLLRLFILTFVSRTPMTGCSDIYVIITALKSLSDNFHIGVLLALASVDLSFSSTSRNSHGSWYVE